MPHLILSHLILSITCSLLRGEPPISVGMIPDIPLLDRSMNSSVLRDAMVVGMEPESEFALKLNSVNPWCPAACSAIEPMLVGICPLN